MKKKNGTEKKCLACGVDFYVASYRSETAKFCSLDCQNHKQYERFKFKCLSCQKDCEDSPSRKSHGRKFCSVECKNILSKTEKERRAMISSLNKISRGANHSRDLRRHIFLQKEPKCEICGYNEYIFCLDLHHIDKDAGNNSLENIAVLCCMCHKKLHKKVIDYQPKL